MRVLLGSLWLVDAALQAQPHFFSYDWWHADLAESVMGQPQQVSLSILWATGHLAAHAAVANGLVIAMQATIGMCLILGRLERTAIAVSIPWALGIWWVGEGFGSIPTGFGSLAGGAPGAVLLYPIVGMLAWPLRDREGGGEAPLATIPAAATWCGLWTGGAILGLPWRFPAAQVLRANIEQNSLGQPHWLTGLSTEAYRLVGAHPALVPVLLFSLQLAVGVGVLLKETRRAAIVVGALMALVFWVFVQDLGSIASGSATDPGSAPLLLLLAVTVASAFRVRARSEARFFGRGLRRGPTAAIGRSSVLAIRDV